MAGRSGSISARIWLTGDTELCAQLVGLLQAANGRVQELRRSGTLKETCLPGREEFLGEAGAELLVLCGEQPRPEPQALYESFDALVGGDRVAMIVVARKRVARSVRRIATISPVLSMQRIALALVSLAAELPCAGQVTDKGSAYRRRVSAVLHRVERLSAFSGGVAVQSAELTKAGTALLQPATESRAPDLDDELQFDEFDGLGDASGIFGQGGGPRRQQGAGLGGLNVEDISGVARCSSGLLREWADGELPENFAEAVERELRGAGRISDVEPRRTAGESSDVRGSGNFCVADDRANRPTIPVPSSGQTFDPVDIFAYLADEPADSGSATSGVSGGAKQRLPSGPVLRDGALQRGSRRSNGE